MAKRHSEGHSVGVGGWRRAVCGGALAMGLTAGIGYLFGTAVGWGER